MLSELTLSTVRRFILGKQGLWPGRRERGLVGTAQAMRAMEYLQLDPLQIIARSQDIALQGRVLDYKPGLWEEVTYGQRQFFDWGGWLAARPMDELPHWRVVMRREAESNERLRALAAEHTDAIAELRLLLRERETVSNRDFEMASRTRTQHYRGRKDSALALYYLWRTGDVMIHHRERFERVYALTERVAPPDLLAESDEAEADRFLVLKDVAFAGLSRVSRTSDAYHRGVPFENVAKIREALVAEGKLIPVKVEGERAVQYALGSDLPLLEALQAGEIPAAWTPLETTTEEEAVFLAPLDPVSARGRAKPLFGFDYIWEVYKPEAKRQFGYYALPILWGERLVGRFDSKLDRTTNTLVVLGFWLEDPNLGSNPAFAEALARGFARFTQFLGAEQLDTATIAPPLLREHINTDPK